VTKQRAIISLIVVRKRGDELEVLLQKRHKIDDDTPYKGYLELPQGKIEARENLTDAASRELSEETGLTLDKVLVGSEQSVITEESASDLFLAHPLLCVADRIQNHVGIAIVVSASGSPKTTKEASHHTWHSLEQLRAALEQERIFPLNRPMIAGFIESVDSGIPDWGLPWVS
jgi:8-oxo-dGTP pyrophosphatase MutT (NUDIX family)